MHQPADARAPKCNNRENVLHYIGPQQRNQVLRGGWEVYVGNPTRNLRDWTSSVFLEPPGRRGVTQQNGCPNSGFSSRDLQACSARRLDHLHRSKHTSFFRVVKRQRLMLKLRIDILSVIFSVASATLRALIR